MKVGRLLRNKANEIAIGLLLLFGVLVCALGGCTDEQGTTRALQAQGFTQIEIVGHAWFGCSKDDATCTKFRAKNSAGYTVEGVVGCGYVFKGCTPRF